MPKSVKKVTKRVVKSSPRASRKPVRKVSKKASRKVSRKTVRKTSRKVSKKASRKVSKKASRKVSKKASRKVSKKTSRKVSKKASRKVSKKTSRKVSKKASRKVSRKTSKKSSRKVSKKDSRKTSKKASRKTSKKTETRTDLIQKIVKKFNTEESIVKGFKKDELKDILSGKLKVNFEKVCSTRKSKEYPNRYSKKELIALARKRTLKYGKKLSTSALKRQTYPFICKLLEMKVIKPEKPAEKPVKKSKKSSSKKEVVRVVHEESCIKRSKMTLKDHQKTVVKFMEKNRGVIVVHDVGSGKTLTAVTASQCFLDAHPRGKVIVVTPTSLQENFKKEMEAYGANVNDSRYNFYTIQSFTNAAKKGETDCSNSLLIIDEAHNLRTEIQLKKDQTGTGVNAQKLVECAKAAKKVLLLTATPVVNDADDVKNLVAMVDGMDARMLTKEFIDAMANMSGKEFDNLFGCKFSFFKPDPDQVKEYYPISVTHEVFLTMDKDYLEKYMVIEQVDAENLPEFATDLYGATNLKAFYNGVRRSSNNLEENQSPKVEWIINKIDESEKKDKFVIFSHFLEAGLELIMNILEEKGIPFAHVDGSMNIKKRKEAVEAYNKNKIKVLLISKAGGEGLDLKGTTNMILMEPAWNETTAKQVIGRGIRFMSHTHLPKSRQRVDVYKLYLLKPRETDDLKEQTTKDSEDKYPLTNLKYPDDKLSVDLYLKNFSLNKQMEINNFVENLQRVSIESKYCKKNSPKKAVGKEPGIKKKAKKLTEKEKKLLEEFKKVVGEGVVIDAGKKKTSRKTSKKTTKKTSRKTTKKTTKKTSRKTTKKVKRSARK